MKIGIIIAMSKEMRQLRSLLSEERTECINGKDFIIGAIGQHEIIMQQCGIGKVNAAVGCVEMINNYHPQLIISTGCAGGADISMQVTDVVVGSEYTYHDVYCGSEQEYGQLMGLPARFTAPDYLIDKALSVSPKVHAGLIVTGDWFVDSQDKMSSIMQQFPQAKAVDMESCAIAHTCYLYQVPFISFRVISDIPLKDEKAAMYYDFWDRIAEGSFNITKHFLDVL